MEGMDLFGLFLIEIVTDFGEPVYFVCLNLVVGVIAWGDVVLAICGLFGYLGYL